jgi:hypothetical protein
MQKKAASYRSIERLRKGLTEDEIKGCYACHTTGYGKPGGFTSPEETPHLKKMQVVRERHRGVHLRFRSGDRCIIGSSY